MKKRLVGYFSDAVARGELAIDNLDLAAAQFMELCKANLFPRLVFGVGGPATAEDRRQVIDGAVDLFLARYGA